MGRGLVAFGGLTLIAGIVMADNSDEMAASAPRTASNTLLRKSCADPWLFRHGGRFYLTQTGGTKVTMEESEALSELSSPKCRSHLAYDAMRDPMLATLGYKGVSGVWSPEIHHFSESDFPGASGWYLFTALRDAAPGDSSRVKSVVLKSLSGRPEGPYGNPETGGKFSSSLVLDREGKPYGGWLVGQSVLRIGSGRWKGVYSLFVTEVGRGTAGFHQEIRIARLAAPWRMATETGVVTVPTQPWESIGSGLVRESDEGRPARYLPRVVEGATAVYGERGDVYLIYSGSGYWTNYGLGQLTWTGGDPLKTSSWVKWKGNPVFSVADASGRHYSGVDRQGAGHASFFTDGDGRRMMAYHAYPYNSSDFEKEVDGTVLAPRRKAKRRNAYVALYSIDYSESNGVGMGVFHAQPMASVESSAAEIVNPVYPRSFPDPTTWRAPDGTWRASSTALTILASGDFIHWRPTGKRLFAAEEERRIRAKWKHIWAPDAFKIGDDYLMYVALVGGGCGTAIAVYSSKEPEGPFAGGRIVIDGGRAGLDVIDPEVVRDDRDGTLWLFFGSTSGIHRLRLAKDGKSPAPGAKPKHVAGLDVKKDPSRQKVFEGAYLHRRGGCWYLFASKAWYANHTYATVVGRSRTLTGEFRDREKRSMKDGFATVVISSNKGDKFFGPGHNGEITAIDGREYIPYHCHVDGENPKARPLFISELFWDKDGWPSVKAIGANRERD